MNAGGVQRRRRSPALAFIEAFMITFMFRARRPRLALF